MEGKGKEGRGILPAVVVLALAACVSGWFAGPVSGAGERAVPALGGGSLRVDFSAPFIEGWRAAPPAEILRATVPLVEGVEPEQSVQAGPWERAAVLGPLPEAGRRTEFRVFYNENGLFFRARCHFDPAAPPVAAPRERNRPSWNEDMVEIRLRVPAAPGAPENPLYHFAVTAAGTEYDSRDGRSAYDARWFSRAEVGESAWTLWVAIPFSALELTLPAPELEINIGRNGPGMVAQSWGPTWSSTGERRLVLAGVEAAPGARDAAPDKEAAAPVFTPQGMVDGRGISLEWTSGFARARERWVEGRVILDPAVLEAGDELEVSLWGPDREVPGPLETVRLEPGRAEGRVMVDLRAAGLARAEVTARLSRGGQVLGSARGFVEARPLPAAPAEGMRVPLAVDFPAVPEGFSRWPLTVGVPFPAGLLWEADGWVVEDGAGSRYPTQLEITGRWSLDGPVKWLRVDTVAPPVDRLYLVYRPGAPPPAPESPVLVESGADTVSLSSGGTRYLLGAGGSPVRSVHAAGRLLADASTTRGLYLVDQRGRLASASAEGAEIVVEAAGPVAACVRIEGDYRTAEGEALARHITRVEMFAGMPFARIVHTLVLTRNTNETWFREAGWEFEVAPGAEPEALFGISRENPGAHHRVSGGSEESWLIQESYFRFGAGEKRFSLVSGGREAASGPEMGDWFLLQGSGGGLVISCRESARQFPKEFHVSGNRMNLKLFSGRAGEEMDFRTGTLVERWNLRDWFLGYGLSPGVFRGRGTPEERLEMALATVRNIPSNAAGWAKTHEVLLAPAPGRRAPAEAATVSDLHSRPVFALADPAWTYRTGAIGPLHPRDPERFPEAEELVDETLAFFAGQTPRFGLWGFIDYNAGPVFNYPAASDYPRPRRWEFTYTLRPDSWKAFARSGSRQAHDFATGTCRAFGDNYFASWDAPGKVRGLHTKRAAPDDYIGSMALPFYWEHGTCVNLFHMADLGQFTLDYHMLGWRRAGDRVRQFAEGVRRFWTPATRRTTNSWPNRVLPIFRVMTQCYEFTWDPAMRELAEDVFDYMRDPEGALGLNSESPYGSMYKFNVHFRDFLAAWEFYGDPKYRDYLLRAAWNTWRLELGVDPVSYTGPKGLLGNYLFGETGSPEIAQEMLLDLQRAPLRLDREAPPGARVSMGSHEATFVFEGIPAVQDVVARTNVDREPAASWASARDFGDPVEFVVSKEDEGSATLFLKSPHAVGSLAGGQRIEMVSPFSHRNLELVSGSLVSGWGYSSWTVPRDAPGGAYRVVPGASGFHHALARGKNPLVVHAPGWWVPGRLREPATRWYFRVPAGSEGAAVFFEGPARVYGPDGRPWRETGGGEWLEPTAESPGLWSFSLLAERLVRARNLPPFFAAGRPENWFDPGIEWAAAEDPGPVEVPDASGFTAGLGEGQGFFISSRDSFRLEGGDELDGDRGRRFLPFREGTVEFWLKPLEWDTFGMPGEPRERAVYKHLLRLVTGREPFSLSYIMNYNTTHHFWTHALHASAFSENAIGTRGVFRSWRPYTVFERNRWVHVALAWRGHELYIFLDGSRGQRISEAAVRPSRPADPPVRLEIPGGGVIDHLRVSDIMRYERDFTPSRSAPAVDGHTRAYFPFDGTLEGVSGDGETVTGILSR